SHRHGFLTQRFPSLVRIRDRDLFGEAPQDACSERAVTAAERGERLLEQSDERLVPDDGGESQQAPAEAERGARELLGAVEPAGDLRRLQRSFLRALVLASAPEGIAEREQELAAPPLGPWLAGLDNLEGRLVVTASLLVRHHGRRAVARTDCVVDRLRGVAALGRFGKVIRELGEVRLRTITIERFEHL